eukprot:SAG22_NODE_2206_length_2839_cov_1.814234_1_plen_680_part_00
MATAMATPQVASQPSFMTDIGQPRAAAAARRRRSSSTRPAPPSVASSSLPAGQHASSPRRENVEQQRSPRAGKRVSGAGAVLFGRRAGINTDRPRSKTGEEGCTSGGGRPRDSAAVKLKPVLPANVHSKKRGRNLDRVLEDYTESQAELQQARTVINAINAGAHGGQDATLHLSGAAVRAELPAGTAAEVSAGAGGDARQDANLRKRALDVLRKNPSTRTKKSVQPLVEWTYGSDVFDGLSQSERQQLCIGASGRSLSACETVVRPGLVRDAVVIVLCGKLAIYTMRKLPGLAVMAMSGERKAKYVSMQRRASIVARSDSVANAPAAASLAALGIGPKQQRSMAEDAPGGDGVNFPVQLTFAEGEAIGLARAFHNNDDAAVKAFGWQRATHTVVALDDSACLVFTAPEHILLLKQHHAKRLVGKVEALKAVPRYRFLPAACLDEMAKLSRRVQWSAGDVLAKQNSEVNEVQFVAKGAVRLVTGLGTPAERIQGVLGTGSCIGDWSVVTGATQTMSVVAHSACEIVCINAFNFRATADPELLVHLGQLKSEQSAAQVNGLPSDADGLKQPEHMQQPRHQTTPRGRGYFTLISRKATREAALAMVQSNDELFGAGGPVPARVPGPPTRLAPSSAPTSPNALPIEPKPPACRPSRRRAPRQSTRPSMGVFTINSGDAVSSLE